MKLLLLPFLTLFLLSSCKKDEPDPVVPDPVLPGPTVPEHDPIYYFFKGLIGTNDNSTIFSADNNLLICGNQSVNIAVLKISKTGTLLWRKDIYPGLNGRASAIAESDNQDLFISGNIWDHFPHYPSDDVLLLKLNSNGDTIWSKTYGHSFRKELGNQILYTSDGNLLIGGISYSQCCYDIYLIKVNTDGDTLWTRTYPEPDEEYAYHLMETQNGEYLVTGSNKDSAFIAELYLLKVSSDGTQLWNKKIGPVGKYGLSTVELSNGDLMTCGKITKDVDNQILVVKTDDHGNVYWEKEYGEASLHEQGNSIQVNADGTLIIFGRSYSNPSDQSGIFLLKINQNGDQLLFEKFGYSDFSHGQNILKDDNDDNIITGSFGTHTSNGCCNYNIFMTRTDNNGVFK